MTKELFMTLAGSHASSFRRATDSDTVMGYLMGLEQAMNAMGNLPELADDPDVLAVLDNIAHHRPAVKRG